MSDEKRITKEDFVVHDQCVFEKSRGSIFVYDKDERYIVTGGNSRSFMGMDQYIAAVMLKNNMNEIYLSKEDLENVDTFMINWMDNGGVHLMSNRLPTATQSKTVCIEKYNLELGSNKYYWDFFTGSESDNCLISMVVIPEDLDIKEQISYITDSLANDKLEPEGISYRPKECAEILNINKTEVIQAKKSAIPLTVKGILFTVLIFLGVLLASLLPETQYLLPPKGF